jgi:hypothetical protein
VDHFRGGGSILSAGIATPAFAYTQAEQEAMYAAASLKKHDGKWFTTGCDHEVTSVLTTVKGGTIGEAAVLEIDGGDCYGAGGSFVMLFRKEENHFQTIFGAFAVSIKTLKTSHMGVFDLKVGGPGSMGIPIWKWNGEKYEFWKSRTAELSKSTKPESLTKASVAVGEPVAAAPVAPDRVNQSGWRFVESNAANRGANVYCGRLLYMPGSFELLQKNMDIWVDEDTRDPKNLTEYLNAQVKRALSCYCIVGRFKPIVAQGDKNRYSFTEVTSLATCDGEVLR